MEKENKKGNSNPKSIKTVKAEKVTGLSIEKDEFIEDTEPLNNIGKIPGKGFGRLLGCG